MCFDGVKGRGKPGPGELQWSSSWGESWESDLMKHATKTDSSTGIAYQHIALDREAMEVALMEVGLSRGGSFLTSFRVQWSSEHAEAKHKLLKI